MNTKIDFIRGNTKKCLLAMTIPMIMACTIYILAPQFVIIGYDRYP